MKFLNVVIIGALAMTIGACGTSTKPAATDVKPDDPEAAKKKDAAAAETAGSDQSTPTAAFNSFIKVYESKNLPELKKHFSKKTIGEMEASGKDGKKSLDEMLLEFVQTPLPFKGTPEIRNEKIDGDKATFEVNVEGKWEPTNFVREDGLWKLDFGEMK